MSKSDSKSPINVNELEEIDNEVLKNVVGGLVEQKIDNGLTWGRVVGFGDWGRKKP